MKNLNSIYGKQNPKLRLLLEQAANPRKVLCVALDYAKTKHVVLFCNCFGDILRKPFPLENSLQGVAQLLDEIQKTCHHRGIDPKHVFFGGEDSPSYALNFLDQLTQKGFLVLRVNAWEAKTQRNNHQASTDKLDVVAIAKTMLQKSSYCDQDKSLALQSLRCASRDRHYCVQQQTALKLQIHHCINKLFPSFLIESKSGIPPFSKASLALMAQALSPQEIQRRRRPALIKLLERQGLEKASEAAEKLQQLAAKALPPCEQGRQSWQHSLGQFVIQFQTQAQCVGSFEKEMARWLAQTPGALLTSINGIGVVLASGVLAELGDPSQWSPLRRLCSYIGIIPKVAQSGGPDKPAQTTFVQKRCNRRAKNWIVQIGAKMGECGPVELKEQYHKLKQNGQHADFIMSKRVLRIAKDLMRRGTVYRPKALLHPDVSQAELKAHYLDLWPRLLAKWRGLISFEELFCPQSPLGQWRQMVQELYHFSLPLPQSHVRKEP
jgi:transposase